MKPNFISKIENLKAESEELFFSNLPKNGMIISGKCYRLPDKPSLAQAVQRWPTIRSTGLIGGGGNKEAIRRKVEAGELSEAEALAMTGLKSLEPTEAMRKVWPTPAARDYKGAVHPDTLAAKGRTSTNSLPDAVRATSEGSLNPDWVEWLMGFPVKWTIAHPSVLKLLGKRKR